MEEFILNRNAKFSTFIFILEQIYLKIDFKKVELNIIQAKSKKK